MVSSHDSSGLQPAVASGLLLTDLYQLNMLQAYLEAGMTETAVFEFFVRKLPPSRNFLIAAGLETVVDFLEGAAFTAAELDWLRSSGRFSEALVDHLEGFRFSGSLHALREGTVCFPDEPLLRHPMSIRRILSAFSGQDSEIDARMSFLALLPPELRRTLHNAESRRTLVTARVQDRGLADYAPVFQRLESDLVDLEKQHPGFRFALTGHPVVGGPGRPRAIGRPTAAAGETGRYDRRDWTNQRFCFVRRPRHALGRL